MRNQSFDIIRFSMWKRKMSPMNKIFSHTHFVCCQQFFLNSCVDFNLLRISEFCVRKTFSFRCIRFSRWHVVEWNICQLWEVFHDFLLLVIPVGKLLKCLALNEIIKLASTEVDFELISWNSLRSWSPTGSRKIN